jgi:predicted DNA-binding protein (UPF0251 family)/predicted Fe-Mo cluster-binding NifX family protein
MPRPMCERRVCSCSNVRSFKPAGVSARGLPEVVLSLDCFEAVRLADLEGLYQEAAARYMGVSRQTFGRIVKTARKTIADAIINGKCLRIEGGPVIMRKEGEELMKIAVPARGELVDEHFGHCEHFMVYTLDEEKKVDAEERVDPPEGCGCKSNIALVLAKMGVTHMVAGNMGEGAVRVLGAHGISVVRGASGSAREAAEKFVAGAFSDSGVPCSGHGTGHHHGGDCHS